MTELLKSTSERLHEVITEAKKRFASISENEWSSKLSVQKWSKKEILGHLVDSAANNHLRFVRAQLADEVYNGNIYEQDFFVQSQKYAEENTEALIDLWYAYNEHLSYIIRHIDPKKLDVSCHIGHYDPVPFSFVITDYVSHMEHHLAQIFSN